MTLVETQCIASLQGKTGKNKIPENERVSQRSGCSAEKNGTLWRFCRCCIAVVVDNTCNGGIEAIFR